MKVITEKVEFLVPAASKDLFPKEKMIFVEGRSYIVVELIETAVDCLVIAVNIRIIDNHAIRPTP